MGVEFTVFSSVACYAACHAFPAHRLQPEENPNGEMGERKRHESNLGPAAWCLWGLFSSFFVSELLVCRRGLGCGACRHISAGGMRSASAHQEVSGDRNQGKRSGTGEEHCPNAELLRQISREQKTKHLGHGNQ